MPRFRRWLLALALVAATYGLRAPWLGRQVWNLDEGSTFTMAEQVLHGQVLYRDAADQRSPLVPYLKAAIFAVAGDWNAHAVHLALLLMAAAGAILLWAIARRLGDEPAGVGAAVFFILLCFLLPDPEDALAAHTEWFVVFFSAIGYWLFVRALSRPTFWRGTLVGLAFGLSTLCKQPGALDLGVTFVLGGLLAVSASADRVARFRLAAGSLAGWAVTLAAAVLYFALNHALRDLLYYTWTFNTKIYVPEVPLAQRLWTVRAPFLLAARHMPVALAAGVIGAGLLLRRVGRGWRRPFETPVLEWLILGWTASGLVSVSLSGRDFSHYSDQVIPGLSLACGWTFARCLEWTRGRRPWLRRGAGLLLVAAAVVTGWNYRSRARLLSKDDGTIQTLGRIVRQYTTPDQRIFVWGYYPDLYFFSRRLPSTRFLYTNFLTGMMPWTNLDPLIDTHYAIVPHAWDDFWADYRRHPPAVIIDTGSNRGYLKYPLEREPELWRTITRDFASVTLPAFHFQGMRLFRRLAPVEPAPPPAGAAVDPAVKLDATPGYSVGHPATATVTAPAGATRVELYRDGRLWHRAEVPAQEPCVVGFFIADAKPAGGLVALQALVYGRGGPHLSPKVEVWLPPEPGAIRPPVRPVLDFGDQAVEPTGAGTADGAFARLDDRGHRWRLLAPFHLSYPRSPELQILTFALEPAGGGPVRTPALFDVAVDFAPAGGQTVRLFHQPLVFPAGPPAPGSLPVRVVVPGREPGNLILRVVPAGPGPTAREPVVLGRLQACARGPDLVLGGQRIPPVAALARGTHSLTPAGDGTWLAHAPARLVYPRAPNLMSLDFTFGLDDRSYAPGQPGHTDGVDVLVNFDYADGRMENLFRRHLDPFANAADRGPQTAHVDLPFPAIGRVVLVIDPGPQHNDAFDWSYVANLRGHGPGPDLVIDADRYLVPSESEQYDGGPIRPVDVHRWIAQAPSRLVYERPADLTAVRFGYSFDPGAYLRSDGADIVVRFEPDHGRPVQLFLRHLRPRHHPADRGPQASRVVLPPGQPGRLIFLITPGPRDDSAFDWTYWGRFRGEVTPAAGGPRP